MWCVVTINKRGKVQFNEFDCKGAEQMARQTYNNLTRGEQFDEVQLRHGSKDKSVCVLKWQPLQAT